MSKFFRNFILVVTIATSVATNLVYADTILNTVPRILVQNDWVYIKEKNNFMYTNLYSDGTVTATKDKAFESTFNGKTGYYATDQEGFMIKGYVLLDNNLYYFQPGGPYVGMLLTSARISYKGMEHDVDEYGRIQGDLKDFFNHAKIYTMGLLKQPE